MSLILFLLLPLLVSSIIDAVLTRLTESATDENPKTEKFTKRARADDIVDSAPKKRYKSQEHSTSAAGYVSSSTSQVATSGIPVFDEPQDIDYSEFTDRNERGSAA